MLREWYKSRNIDKQLIMNENILLIRDICEKFDINVIKNTFNITPLAAPRMTGADKWQGRKCVVKYFNFRNKLNLLALQQNYKLTCTLSIIFSIPYPESWSEKKKKENYLMPVTVKPDIDNLIKSFMDSLSSADQNVWSVTAKKIYAPVGAIFIY